MNREDPLGEEVRGLFSHLDHAGEPPAAGEGLRWVRGEAGDAAQGTRVCLSLGVGQGLIRAVRFRAYGCPYTLAACEWLARTLEGQTAASAAPGGALLWAERLDIPVDRLGRLLVIEDALQASLTQL